MSEINVKTIKIDNLVPYWRNPRKNDLAVQKVTASIKEFGYQQPIIVDTELVIIAGHTRYAALKALGYEEVQVIITDMPAKKAKEFRIIDNRTSEYATWTQDLALELKEFTDPAFLDIFFPDVKLDPDFAQFTDSNNEATIQAATANITERFEKASESRATEPKIVIPCPYCAEEITLLRADLMKEKNWEV